MSLTDDFTRAARTEAEGKFPPPRESALIYPLAAVRSHSQGAFLAGAEWARAYLAAQEVSDAEKDAAMDALGCELRVVENGQSTCELHGGYATSDDVCEVVEGTLSAARAARRNEEKR